MTEQDLSSLAAQLPNARTMSLGERSKSDQGVACLDDGLSSSRLTAIDFDSVKDAWYGRRFFHRVRSCDALYRHGESYCLIEFKTGKATNLGLHRKLYDSVIALTEHGVLDLETCRSNVQFVVVSPSYEPSSDHREMLSHFERVDPDPWDYEVTRDFLETVPRDDIRRLSGFLVDKVYRLSPQDFDKFTRNRNWSN